MFSVGRMQIRNILRFRQNGPFLAGDKLGAKQKHIKKKTRKHKFHGIIPGFLGDFVYVFFSPIRNVFWNT